MKLRNFLPLALCLALLVYGQAAKQANEHYRTEQQRRGVAAGLGRPDRDAQQKPRDLVEALQLKPGMTVADVGTGVGYMLPFLSRAVGPEGRVLAEDIYDDFLQETRKKVEQEKLDNVELVKGVETDPNLPADSVDLILALDSYHHYDYPEKMLGAMRRALREEGRLAIVEYYKRPYAMRGDRDAAMKHIRLDRDDLVREVEAHGFRLLSVQDHVKDSQYLAFFGKK